MEYELYHHGVKGMKWGVRKARKASISSSNKNTRANDDRESNRRKGLTNKQKNALKIGAAVATTALAAYGAYKLSKFAKEKAYAKSLSRGKKAIEECMKSFDDKHVYGLRGDKLTVENIEKGLVKSQALGIKLGLANEQYAKRSSKNTVQAVKTLLNKNNELPLADLVRTGVVDPNSVINRSWVY